MEKGWLLIKEIWFSAFTQEGNFFYGEHGIMGIKKPFGCMLGLSSKYEKVEVVIVQKKIKDNDMERLIWLICVS